MDDELLRFFDHCHGYVEGVEKNRTALQDVEKFKRGEEMEALRRRTARRLGLHHEFLTTGQTSRLHSGDALTQRCAVLNRGLSADLCVSCRSAGSGLLHLLLRAVNQIYPLAMVLPV